MEPKLKQLNDDMLASKIENKMDQISSGELAYPEVLQALEEIKTLVAKMDPETGASYMMYCDMLAERVARHYAKNNQAQPDSEKGNC